MNINIIDYRGDDTVVSDDQMTIFRYRTRYFFKQQEDFHHWKQYGHRFICFTQHENRTAYMDDYAHYDEVIRIPRGNASQSRNHVLNHYPPGEWIGIWDNDATLYFDKLESERFVRELDQVCAQADSMGISSFVPFNAQQAPYPLNPKPAWTFVPRLEQKGTMLWCKVADWRFDEQMLALEDWEFACNLALQGKRVAQCQQVSLKEYTNGKSTIFHSNVHHANYPNRTDLPKWACQLDRLDKYAAARQYIENKFGMTIDAIKKQHQENWK